MTFAGLSDRGIVRDTNEDRFLANGAIFAVADGVGGHQAGEVASALAIDELAKELSRESAGKDTLAHMKLAIEAANRTVYEAAVRPEHRGMATTMTAAVFDSNRMYLGHVGDSRAYLFRDGRLTHLTSDHSLVQELVRQGKLASDEASSHPQRNLLTRALGSDKGVQIDLLSIEVEERDRVLLSTDGLFDRLSDDEIAKLLDVRDGPDATCRSLIDAANEQGGPDNITAVVIDITGA